MAVAVGSGTPVAHHSFTPVYDGGRTIRIEGVVTDFRFINPHSMMAVDVTNVAGKTVRWTVEFPGRLNLSEDGWTEKTILAGQHVTVTGNPAHTGSPRMYFRELTRADGTRLATNLERQREIEEIRRQRRAQRQQK